eukprot:m.230464 g.230464  ORF g.230464 m.230464 type:complete len:235 (-) comp17060_c3_seq4:2437-3141(-)
MAKREGLLKSCEESSTQKASSSPTAQQTTGEQSQAQSCTLPYGASLHEDLSISDEQCARAVVNTNQGYCLVVKTRLGDSVIVTGGEVDCLDPDTQQLVELKTIHAEALQRPSFKRFKLLKWWAQSFLIGIDTIIYGVRVGHNQLKSIHRLRVSEIPRSVRGTVQWDPAMCMTVTSTLLSKLRAFCRPGCMYLVTSNSMKQEFDIHETQNDDHRFLPAWFCDLVGKEATAAARRI